LVGHVGVVVHHESPVEVQHAAQTHLVLSVGGLDRESTIARLHGCVWVGRGSIGFFLEFVLALQDEDLLFLFVEPSQQFLDGRLRRSRGQR